MSVQAIVTKEFCLYVRAIQRSEHVTLEAAVHSALARRGYRAAGGRLKDDAQWRGYVYRHPSEATEIAFAVKRELELMDCDWAIKAARRAVHEASRELSPPVEPETWFVPTPTRRCQVMTPEVQDALRLRDQERRRQFTARGETTRFSFTPR